jgi:hypothetical protein
MQESQLYIDHSLATQLHQTFGMHGAAFSSGADLVVRWRIENPEAPALAILNG